MKPLLLRACWICGLLAAIGLHVRLVRGDLIVAWSHTVQLYDERTGALVAQTTNSYRGETLTSITVGPDGNIYGPQNFGGPGSVIRFDARTANVMDEFVPYDDYNAALWTPGSARFGPDGNLYVGSFRARNGKSVIYRFDGKTGEGKGVLALDATLSAGLFAFGPDGNIYLFSHAGDSASIARVHPLSGELIGQFATLPTLSDPYGWRAISFGPDGNLYLLRKNIYRVDGKSGQSMGLFVDTGAAGITNEPFQMAIGPDGDIYLAGRSVRLDVWRFDGKTGASKGIFVHGPAPLYGDNWIAGLGFSGPRISIVSSSGGLEFRWPQSAGEYAAEWRATLDEAWKPFEPSAQAQEGEYSLTAEATGDQRFFRLVKR